MDPSLDKINTWIPKQVRDDNRGDFQKVMMCMTAFADSENAIIRLNLVQHLVLCSLTFQIHGFIIVDAFEERIPKQVRDDKEREFQKVMSG